MLEQQPEQRHAAGARAVVHRRFVRVSRECARLEHARAVREQQSPQRHAPLLEPSTAARRRGRLRSHGITILWRRAALHSRAIDAAVAGTGGLRCWWTRSSFLCARQCE